MRRLKKVLFWFLGIMAVLNAGILITGNAYLYKTFYYHKASIDDYKIFDKREVAAGTFVPVPESVTYNKTKLNEDFRKVLEDFNTIAFLVLKDDSILYEEYWDGYNADSYSGSFSMAKSIVSVLVGIAIDEGEIKSIDQKVSDFIPEYREGLNAELTIRHLLTMSAGFDWDESYMNPFSLTARSYFGSGLVRIIKKLKVVDKPGIAFNYQSCNTLVLAYIIEQSTGKKLSDYASEKLWKPLGAKHNAIWSLDGNDGFEKAFCCFNSNARDFSKIGLLALHKGMYNGTQIVSEQYMAESVSAAPLVDENAVTVSNYGYAWWRDKLNGEDFYYARGILGQFIIVLPLENMVIVRLGKKTINYNDLAPAVVIADFTLKNLNK
jgi:CubicO group peptidase (beta-lactamase class C family)